MRALGYLGVMAGAAMLAGCGGQDAPPSPASPPVPATIERLSQAAFPADGEIHVQRRGRIVITPTTPVCDYPHSFGVGSVELFGALGQPYLTNSGDRQDLAVEGRCDFSGDVVLTRGIQLPNRNGTPYKLVLAVWQGDVDSGAGAYWVGSVERDQQSIDAVALAFVPDEPEIFDGPRPSERELQSARTTEVRMKDQRNMSALFVSYVASDRT